MLQSVKFEHMEHQYETHEKEGKNGFNKNGGRILC